MVCLSSGGHVPIAVSFNCREKSSNLVFDSNFNLTSCLINGAGPFSQKPLKNNKEQFFFKKINN